jgi:hypothetical protein
MAVHVGEIHTDLSGPRAYDTDGAKAEGDATPRYPGAREDEWRGIQTHVHRLRGRVSAEDFDD